MEMRSTTSDSLKPLGVSHSNPKLASSLFVNANGPQSLLIIQVDTGMYKLVLLYRMKWYSISVVIFYVRPKRQSVMIQKH